MKSHYLFVDDGVRIHYVVAGPADAPPVLLIHGYPTDWRLWRRCIEPLAENYRVYAIDLPGHGWSDRRPDIEHDVNFYVRAVLGFLDSLSLERVHLVAHDLGGMVGLALAGRHRERIDRFVVLDTGPYSDWDWWLHVAMAALRSRLGGRLMTTRLGFTLTLWLFTTRNREVLRRLVQVYRPMWSDTPLQRDMFRLAASLPPERVTPTAEDLGNIDSPTLILWAEADPLFPVSVARKLQRDLRDARLETVPDSGHFVSEEYPEIVTSQVLDFLAA